MISFCFDASSQFKGAGIDGYPSNRGDEFAFVATRPIAEGEECKMRNIVFVIDLIHILKQ